MVKSFPLRGALRVIAGSIAFWMAVAGCAAVPRDDVAREARSVPERVLTLDASAFNSLPDQTDSTPNLTASGARLEPGMRALAVSRDLEALGLRFGTRVRIDGVSGDWVVLDRMHPRWRQKIDLYMGTDVEAAREWGIRTVTIRWSPRP